MTDYGSEQPPYIVDNGVFTGDFNPEEWTQLLDDVLEMPINPTFVILPDVFNDAEATIERNKKWLSEVTQRDLEPAAVAQPGLPAKTQIKAAKDLGVNWVFVGGKVRWKRDKGKRLVELAHAHDMKIHIGNPSGPDGLPWAYKMGFDSADTTTVVASESYHYLENLHEAMTTMHLVGCTASKRNDKSKAKNLYDESAIFRKRKRVLPPNASWRILSAEHGLVHPETQLNPYNTHIKDVETDMWGQSVVDKLPEWIEKVVILASDSYASPIKNRFNGEIETPLSGLRPGEQMQKLNRMADTTEQQPLTAY